MQIGFLTACMGDRKLGRIVKWAGKEGFDCLEISSGHLDTAAMAKSPAKAKQVVKLLKDNGIEMSSIAHYANVMPADPAERKAAMAGLETAMEAAAAAGCGVVCALAGMAVPGKSKMQTIETDGVEVWPKLMKRAKLCGVKIAFENWFATLFQHLGHWRRLFELVDDPNMGLNFDPSHLMWQGIDYLAAVDEFAPRIFHTHAKDTEVRQHVLRDVGCLEGGWWRYVIPGYGEIDWGVYIARLRRTGYNGVLSIEHEDGALGVEEGLLKGRDHLKSFA